MGVCGCYVTPVLISLKYLSTSSIWVYEHPASIKSLVKECINVDLIVFGYDANSFDNGIKE